MCDRVFVFVFAGICAILVCVYVCICMYVRIDPCLYACVSICFLVWERVGVYVCTHSFIFACVCVSVKSVCARVYIWVCVYVYVCVCLYLYLFGFVCSRVWIRIVRVWCIFDFFVYSWFFVVHVYVYQYKSQSVRSIQLLMTLWKANCKISSSTKYF